MLGYLASHLECNMQPPFFYKADSTSSLIIAFKNLDGKRLKSLLAARHLYTFGTSVSILLPYFPIFSFFLFI